jgi:hypothetical protein
MNLTPYWGLVFNGMTSCFLGAICLLCMSIEPACLDSIEMCVFVYDCFYTCIVSFLGSLFFPVQSVCSMYSSFDVFAYPGLRYLV